VRPAINVGISVSRVGGNAQIKAMKQVAGRLRLDLAQFRELEAFSAFGSDLDRASRAQLERGVRLVELLKQPQYSPFPVERQVVSIWAGTSGQLDDIPVADIRRFESDLLDFIGRERSGIYETILQTGALSDDTISSLESAVRDFKKQFVPSEDQPVPDAAAAAMDAADEGQEAITRYTPPPPDEGGSTSAHANRGERAAQ
jgi:F-type H+-transporting ATPase subunit alpha